MTWDIFNIIAMIMTVYKVQSSIIAAVDDHGHKTTATTRFVHNKPSTYLLNHSFFYTNLLLLYFHRTIMSLPSSNMPHQPHQHGQATSNRPMSNASLSCVDARVTNYDIQIMGGYMRESLLYNSRLLYKMNNYEKYSALGIVQLPRIEKDCRCRK